jgi:hypothetical protein
MKIQLGILLIVSSCFAADLPPFPSSIDSAVEEIGTNEPIRTTIAWNGQTDADAFSLVFRGVTNLTTGTNYTLETPTGTNRLELRAHKGTLASVPVVTNLVVGIDTIINHWPETSSKVTGPWTKTTFGSVTNPVNTNITFVRVGQSMTVITNAALK